MKQQIHLRQDTEAELNRRFDELETKIREPAFFTATRATNTVNYWVFDYNPKQELLVRQRLAELRANYEKREREVKLYFVDLYELLIQHLEHNGYIEMCKRFECEDGLAYLTRAIKNSLQLTDSSGSNAMVDYITQMVPAEGKNIIFLTGVGKCFPFLQGAEVFNQILYNMPDAYRRTPIILFYPGTYTEQELIIFNKFSEDNYYRAFRIVR